MRNLRILLILLFCACAKKIVQESPIKFLKDLPIIPEQPSNQGDISKIHIYDVTLLPLLPTFIKCSYVVWAPDDSSLFVASSSEEENFIYNFRTGEWLSVGKGKPQWIDKEVEKINQTKEGYSLSPDGLYRVSFSTEPPYELVISSTRDVGNFIIPADTSGHTFKQSIFTIWRMGIKRRIVIGGENSKPAWSHNGKYIAIVNGDWTLTECVPIIALGGYQPQISQPAPKEETPSVKVCPQCGEKYPDSYNRCPKCGVRLKPKE